MENGSPVGRAILTVVAVVGFFVFVAFAINTYDTDEYEPDIARAAPAGSSGSEPSPAAPSAAPPAVAPVGGVATGGGGTAAESASLALPVFGALASLTLLAAARMLWRPRGA